MIAEERLKEFMFGKTNPYAYDEEYYLDTDIQEILNQNQQLKERLDKMSEKEYLEYRDELQLHGTRELAEEVIRLEKENQQLKDNWNKLEEYLKEEIKRNSGNSIDLSIRSHLLLEILSKMQELGGSNE